MGALTSLKQASQSGVAIPGAAAQPDRNGRPDEMPLNKIHPDPNNSRRPEDENTSDGIDEQQELTADIKKRGVKSPISLRPHPKIKGEYMINFGHRRLKGARDAGFKTIPYFLDINVDSYDQVKENLLHRKPSIWALAEFVQRKLNVENQSKGQVAEGLGKNQNVVTELLNLVNAPSCLHQAYTNGVKSPRTLYDLRRAYEEFPEQVDGWCDSGAMITRNTIQDLLRELRHDVKTRDAGGSEPAGEQVAAANGTTAVELRNAVKEALLAPQSPAARGLRHDVKKAREPAAPKAPLVSPKASKPSREIIVQYKGKTATIAPDTTVSIVVDGQDVPLEVPLSELVFEGAM